MTPRELLTAAYRRQERAIDHLPWWATSDKAEMLIVRDWLRDTANSDICDVWLSFPAETLEAMTVFRMARKILGPIKLTEADVIGGRYELAVPTLPEADR